MHGWGGVGGHISGNRRDRKGRVVSMWGEGRGRAGLPKCTTCTGVLGPRGRRGNRHRAGKLESHTAYRGGGGFAEILPMVGRSKVVPRRQTALGWHPASCESDAGLLLGPPASRELGDPLVTARDSRASGGTPRRAHPPRKGCWVWGPRLAAGTPGVGLETQNEIITNSPTCLTPFAPPPIFQRSFGPFH